MSTTFADLQINAPLVAILRDQKMETPTPVQVEAIPLILAGRDALIESPTGTGKTFAYLLPLLTKIDMDKKDVQVLVLAPTHELVVQIAKEAEKLLPGADHAVLPIIGGVDVKRQVERLKKKPVLVVATPGRLLELIDQRKLKVHEVKTVVVDEADRMLDAGFGKPVQEVMKKTLRDTQRLLFSATISDQIVAAAKAFTKEAALVRAQAPEGAAGVAHLYLVSDPRKKVDTLRRLLRLVNVRSSIVFVNQIEKVDEIVSKLNYHHLECRLLHRDASKEERARTLQKFRDGAFPVLITTDVSARGIDIPEVECIVHYDPAPDADTYIHRSGRTGRMGRAGLVFSILSPQERFIIQKFAKQTELAIAEKTMAYGALEDPRPERKPAAKPTAKPAGKGKPQDRKAGGGKPPVNAGKESSSAKRVHKKGGFGTK
ncbi:MULTISPECIES: DEAD/DEAH box helicase [Brevibacillus]|uniref:DEAD/DEAH box family ATP-dependent RNA helicase n=1 Tax=Brevibacillus parabrevis TaxID=54914 RepID=A0A4Y3PQU2_BREPA|nr:MULTISPECIES: DEAD/DEAH box helicase [Brevibacillus]NRQ53809.1 DEAD/DEAH box helicase [Brevibacillus sp. HD1.4A]RNB94497.1 DEAD/DEAH box helicase [Brevibacillus parabrevis]GEB33758.1 DEAD/DEAH box family ATP-dependent RNA helicase [Brevibacillus parabrevis]HBZ79962.1 DEAD/DEAH box helicase [Brevibacillus sp.]